MNPSDYILVLRISERGLAEGKRPPLCDGCGLPIPKEEDGDYSINCLILDGEIFNSVQCDDCVKQYFSKVQEISESSVPKEVRQAVRLALSQDMEVVFLP